jgi:SAM-dependent methyltransferase
MEKTEYDKINRIEQTHWWYVGTREIALQNLDKYCPFHSNLTIYDIGCGTGGNIQALSKYGLVEGSDVDPYAVNFCKEKGLSAEVADMYKLDLEPERYDLITFFEVLSQAEEKDLVEILKNVNKGLKKGGILLLREPALKIAGGQHDIAINAKTRFDKILMRSILEESGFKVKYVTYMNSLLFIPIVAKRKLDELLKKDVKSDVEEHSELSNKLFLKILRFEKFLNRYVNFPFGVSILVIAQKA